MEKIFANFDIDGLQQKPRGISKSMIINEKSESLTSLNSSRRESHKVQAIMELRHKFDLDLLLNQTNMA